MTLENHLIEKFLNHENRTKAAKTLESVKNMCDKLLTLRTGASIWTEAKVSAVE